MEARKTEYKGVQFRSKCEAMFALWLDLKYQEFGTEWEYEPTWASVGKYVPDFVMRRLKETHFISNLGLYRNELLFFEYKPARPTGTYLDEVCKKLKTSAETAAKLSTETRLIVGAAVFFGSVYTDDRGVYYVTSSGGYTSDRSNFDWIGENESNLTSYRFDLVNQVSLVTCKPAMAENRIDEKKAKAIADLLKWEAARNGR
jgi:hypothetical protein